VVCEKLKCEAEVRRYLDTHDDLPGLHFAFLPEKAWAPLAWRIPGVGYLSYNLWQRRALRLARALHKEVGFDLVHHVNIIGFREPGYLWKLGLPFVWGPIGGTQNYPWRFLLEAGVPGALSEAVRNVLNRLQFRWSCRVRRACRVAASVIAANSTGQRDFMRVHGVSPILMREVGVAEVCDRRPQRMPYDRLRILWSGSLITRKALSILIKALAQLPTGVKFELRVVGDGPLRSRSARLACRLGIDRHVTWLGQLSHSDALEQYSWADVFVFTSLRDTGGTVVPEALAAGLPVVCLDHQGVHDVVTDDCGIRIPVTTPVDVVGRLSDTIADLASDPLRLEQLSLGALERAHDYVWSRRGEQLAAVYRTSLGDGFLWQPREGLDEA